MTLHSPPWWPWLFIVLIHNPYWQYDKINGIQHWTKHHEWGFCSLTYQWRWSTKGKPCSL